jgi:WD40 repeat protein
LWPPVSIALLGSNGGIAHLWDVATDRRIATFTDPGGVGVKSVAFSPGGATLATGDANGCTYLCTCTDLEGNRLRI